MVLKKEYRICMPLTTEEYRIGQLYMIARHSHEESVSGDGIEVVSNRPCQDAIHGTGQFTEKKLHLSNRLPYWIQSVLPRVFYVVERSWNYYPYTITEYTCNFLQRFHILIKTRFEDNNGTSENSIGLTPEELSDRTVDHIDIAYDDINPRKYKEEEDPKFFQSKKTGRGPLIEGWRDSVEPIMCSYKYVQVSFEVWGLQGKVEDLIQKAIRDVLLLGHRQAFTWIDEWYGMTISDVRIYESQMQKQTNEIVMNEEAEVAEEAEKAENAENAEKAEKVQPRPEGASGDSGESVNPLLNGVEASQTSTWGSWFSWS